MSIKILQISAAYKPAYIYGGPTMSVAKLCEALTKTNVAIEVLTTTANGKIELNVRSGEQTEVDGVKVTYFRRLTKDHTHFSPALLLALRKKITEQKIQTEDQKPELIIHIHAWWNLVSIFSCLVAKYYGIPVLLSPRGMLTDYTSTNRNGEIKSIIHTIFGKKLLRYCHIHATSEKEKQDVLEIIQPKSITVIPNLVDLPLFPKNDVKNVQSPFKLIFLSRVEEKKGLELLFEALVNLPFAWELTIAGSGEEEYVKSLKNKIEKLELTKKINWVGHVNNENKFELIANHHLLVLTSYNENFANVVIESLSVGTPVLLSDQVGLADYVRANQLGWITALDNDSISDKIIEACQDHEKRLKIHDTAANIISKDFDTKNLTSQYKSLYHSIL